MTHVSAGSGRSTTLQETFSLDSKTAVLARNWWIVGLRGVLAIGFGLIALFVPAATILSIVLLFAAYMLVDGVFAIASAVRAASRDQQWGLLAVQGLLDIAIGVLAFLWPGVTAFVFVLLIAGWAFVTGVLMVASAFSLRIEHGRWWMVLSGIASVIFGVLLVVAPMIGAVVLTWWLGIYAIVFGVGLIALAFRLRSLGREPSASPLSSAAG